MTGAAETPDPDEDDARPTEAVDVPWGSVAESLDDFDPDSFDVGGHASTHADQGEARDDADPFGHLTTGSELGGRYRLERILGRGGCGVVFEASHMIIGKKVAVKCLYPGLRQLPAQVERFFREARIAATVDHPNVVKVFDGGDERDTLFLAMELCVGETLADRLERGPIAVEEAVELFLKIIDGVAAVHDKGVVHRDLKPENVFLTVKRDGSPGEPKVLDFGVSKLKEPGAKELTALGAIMGTPYYMAPEQMMNAKGVDVRADVYSLGVMLYEAIAGQLPYEGENIADVFTAAKRADWVPLHRLEATVSTPLSMVVAKAMSVDRNDRYGAVRDLHRALAAALAAGGLDPGAEASRTIEDVRSPLAGRSDEELDRLARPPSTETFGDESAVSRWHATKTVELPRSIGPGAGGVPTWAIVAMVALGLLAAAGIGVALLVLLW